MVYPPNQALLAIPTYLPETKASPLNAQPPVDTSIVSVIFGGQWLLSENCKNRWKAVSKPSSQLTQVWLLASRLWHYILRALVHLIRCFTKLTVVVLGVETRFQSLGLLVVFGHSVSKWRRTFVGRGRHKALFTNLCCVLIVESLNGDHWPVIFWSVDHHFHGCTSLYYVSHEIFQPISYGVVLHGLSTDESWSWNSKSWSWTSECWQQVCAKRLIWHHLSVMTTLPPVLSNK